MIFRFARETGLILRNTLLVTLTVVLGFTAGNLLGLPTWLWGFCLLPAGILFYKLSGEKAPPWWKLVAFFGGLSVLVLLGKWLPSFIPLPVRMIPSLVFCWLCCRDKPRSQSAPAGA
jgi:hypothetical protein